MAEFLSSYSIHVTAGYFEKNANFSYEIKTEDDLESCLSRSIEKILLMDSMCCKCSDIEYITDCLNEELSTGLNYLSGDPLNRYYRMLLLNKLTNSPQYTLALEYVTGLQFYPTNAVFKSIIDRIKDV
ncbi:hypothetical protein HNQ07_002688 [Deinococcus metalli]|nr:hypothetical protein [Deinococcus metalli]